MFLCPQATGAGAESGRGESQEGGGGGKRKEVTLAWSEEQRVQQNVNACLLCRDAQRDFSIELDTEEEWEALSLSPNQPLLTRKVLWTHVVEAAACQQPADRLCPSR